MKEWVRISRLSIFNAYECVNPLLSSYTGAKFFFDFLFAAESALGPCMINVSLIFDNVRTEMKKYTSVQAMLV